jgi:hypothetical protein
MNARHEAQVRELRAIHDRRIETQEAQLSYLREQSFLRGQEGHAADAFADPVETYVEKIVHFTREADALDTTYARRFNGLRAAGVL